MSEGGQWSAQTTERAGHLNGRCQMDRCIEKEMERERMVGETEAGWRERGWLERERMDGGRERD